MNISALSSTSKKIIEIIVKSETILNAFMIILNLIRIEFQKKFEISVEEFNS